MRRAPRRWQRHAPPLIRRAPAPLAGRPRWRAAAPPADTVSSLQPSKATTAFLAAVKKFVRNAGTTKQKNMVGTSLRRLAIKTSSSLQRSVGSAIVAYRRVCQKGAGSEGA